MNDFTQLSPESILQMGTDFWASKVLLARRPLRPVYPHDLLMSLNTLVETGTGFDYTLDYFNRWARQADSALPRCYR